MSIELQDPRLFCTQASIGGHWVDAGDGAVHAVRDPASGEVIAHVPDLGAADTLAAIEAAQRAFELWREWPAARRAGVLKRWFELVLRHEDDLAMLLTREQGKPLAEAKAEIRYGGAYIEWFAEEARRAYGEIIPAPTVERRILVLRQPVGVVAAITPWNFPAAMITRKVAPALAAGCTCVVKPAEATPLTALALAVLAERAGIPAGVINVVTTSRPQEVGAALTGSPLVRKLSFTGSTGVGKHLMAACASTVKKLSLELGGNAPFIVFEDADLDLAVRGAIASKFRNAGQTCVCANRLLVHERVHDEFAERLAVAVRALKVGSGIEPGAQIGPLIDARALDKVNALVSDALGKGARSLCGGEPHSLGGLFFAPTVLVDCDTSMRILREEIFGPVAPLLRFSSTDEAVRLANASDAGLAAYFYTRDTNRAWRVAERLETGMVGINEGAISTEVAPFGGIKESGFGREGSRLGMDEYMQTKYVCQGSVEDERESAGFASI